MRDKQFLNDFRERPTASEVLLKDFGVAGGREVTIRADEVEAHVKLSARRAFAGQELGVAVDFNVKPPWHVYGEPLPQNYTATALRFDDVAAVRQSLAFPKPQSVKIASLGEVLPVYTGSFSATGSLVLKGSLKAGDHQLGGKLSFQECNSKICKLPRTVDFALPVTIEPPADAAK
ncbi:MAG TPA: protein-disulfide reductase DsbD domain-containing protein [Candidatus Binataceae bacterium]